MIMKTLLKTAFLLIGAPLFLFVKVSTAQNGQSQSLPEFDKIKLDGSVSVELILANRHSAYREDGITALDLKVQNGTLVIDNASSGAGKGTVKVYAQHISSVKMDGASSLKCTDTIKATSMDIHMDGMAKANLVIAATNTRIDADGAANLVVSGQTQNLQVEVDGASKVNAGALAAQNVTVEADGAARASVQAAVSLHATSDGMSRIDYLGSPSNKVLSFDGLSSIKSITSGEVFDDKAITGNDPESTNDTTRIKLGNRKLLIIEDDKEEGEEEEKDEEGKRRRMKPVYAGFEMGVNGFATPSMNMNFDNPYKFMNTRLGNSWFFGLNLLEVNGHIIRNKLALTTGFGMQWSNYRFDGDTYLTPNLDSLGGTLSADALKTNKLYTFDLNAPFLLKFAPGTKSKAKGGFHIAAGAIVRYVTTARVTTETTANGYRQRTKFDDDFNINPFRVDATVRVGYDRVKLFVNYGLTPYFNNSKAPDIRNFAAGITVIGF